MGKADMFTFDETPVKFIGLLVLLSWCTIWCLYELTGSRMEKLAETRMDYDQVNFLADRMCGQPHPS